MSYTHDEDLDFMLEELEKVRALLPDCPTEMLKETVVSQQRLAHIYEARSDVYEKLAKFVGEHHPNYDLSEVIVDNEQSRILTDACYRLINAIYVVLAERGEE